ncbi:hypothetical protein J6590_039487 [Homalodisca vitripennis]|nr:hypothetical protein J6590_039487 [Homalodisca vitripennis]
MASNGKRIIVLTSPRKLECSAKDKIRRDNLKDSLVVFAPKEEALRWPPFCHCLVDRFPPLLSSRLSFLLVFSQPLKSSLHRTLTKKLMYLLPPPTVITNSKHWWTLDYLDR